MPFERGQAAQLAPDAPVAPATVAIGASTIFDPAWFAILEASGIPLVRIPVPHGRKRRMFVEGFTVIDCCSTPEWRNRPEEVAVQLFSDSFYESIEHYVFREGEVVNITGLEQLKPLRFAAVRGFTYPHAAYAKSVVPGRDWEDVLLLIEKHRADVSVMSEIDFYARIEKRPRALLLGQVVNRAKLRVRVHKSRAELLPLINAAIARLKENGQLDSLLTTPNLMPSKK